MENSDPCTVCATSPVLHITIPCPQAPAAIDATVPIPEEPYPPDAPLTGKLLLSFSLIFLLISYLGPFLCDNCGEIHPTPFCPKDCNSTSLSCANHPGSSPLWPCGACFCCRQQVAQFSTSGPPSCLFSPVCIDILTGGGAWDWSSPVSPDSPSGMSNSLSH